MFNKIKELLFGKPTQAVVEVPYKIETPAVVEGSANRVETPEPAPTVVKAPVAKAPAKKQQFEKKQPVAKAPAVKAPVKPKAPPKPRAPRKPVAK
jgi:hypothetical protein